MKVFASHDSALDYWRYHFSPDMEIGDPIRTNPSESYAYKKQDVLGCYPEWYVDQEKPVHVLVFDGKARGQSPRIASHLWSADLPDGAFHGRGSFRVSSPEFLFLQMATSLTTVQLIALGCELCGTYILLPKDVVLPGVFDDCPERVAPLTNKSKIAALLDAVGSAHGIKKARRALKYVEEGSRSPMETRTYMQLCLPVLLGGYGLPRAVLNPEIKLNEEARKISGQRFCWGDICWDDEHLDVEYNGSVHSGVEKMRRDAGRVLGIEHMGWRVITVTGLQVFDRDKFEVVAKEVAAHLKFTLRSSVLGHTPARIALHEELDLWMSRV